MEDTILIQILQALSPWKNKRNIIKNYIIYFRLEDNFYNENSTCGKSEQW